MEQNYMLEIGIKYIVTVSATEYIKQKFSSDCVLLFSQY